MSSNIKQVSTKDLNDVAAVVQVYIDGLRKGDNDLLKTAFHKDATMYDIQGRCDILDMTPTTAVVRISLENDASGGRYFDHHTLLKMKDKWEIITKTFHMYNVCLFPARRSEIKMKVSNV
ncbi:uncharacterized protein NECHADRAFT_84378 [Fusarium vanettenii 77-13-4]|uniref:Uncharacterized protein n=1 Tax=Fusarium vanettenii (strain ATCC MYA-4622 / CBS 123669 / FGSC 9596 / NRRL 45880 / 77-13-4) TaxID=660122 RepID=C7ZCY0_FUSV7|nr:uncharacterized protein NECHADRAFT_84378 [Fusarium vanettenii 77-13-4]EEU37997.1 hypothetical protein NECHADRAFT_84378 [Fusarium vanettenii 77-13-4]